MPLFPFATATHKDTHTERIGRRIGEKASLVAFHKRNINCQQVGKASVLTVFHSPRGDSFSDSHYEIYGTSKYEKEKEYVAREERDRG